MFTHTVSEDFPNDAITMMAKGIISCFTSRTGDSYILSRNASKTLNKMFLVPTAVANRNIKGCVFLPLVLCDVGRSAYMDEGHDCTVLVLQTLRVSVAQRVVFFYNSVAADLTVSEQAEERGVGEHLVKGVGLYVGLVFVEVFTSPQAGEHKPNGVLLGNLGCF